MTIYEFLSQLNYKPISILDIGANVGDFSLFCKHKWPEARIYMIEGNSNCEDKLRTLDIPYRIKLLSNIPKKVNFYISNSNPICTGSSYYKELTSHYSDANFTEIDTVTLDSLNLPPFDFIKIDTQGSELDIMKGGLNTLKNAYLVLLEVSVKAYNEGSPLLDDINEFMEENGFVNSRLIEQHVWMNSEDDLYPVGTVFQIDMLYYR